MTSEIRILRAGEEGVLSRVAPDVFDDPIVPARAAEFIADPRHHLAVAIDDGVVVGFVSAVHYVHPDKVAPELWINEVSVASTHRGHGIAQLLLRAMLEEGSRCDCSAAWVLTHRSNHVAMRLYSALHGKAEAEDAVMFSYPLSPLGPAVICPPDAENTA
jgi:ribosomal protein S18 acetylase RimI-like enzyme